MTLPASKRAPEKSGADPMFILSADRMEPITIKIVEAVRLTGISRSRLYELIAAGEIETAKVGTSTLVIVASLRRFIDAHRRAATGI